MGQEYKKISTKKAYLGTFSQKYAIYEFKNHSPPDDINAGRIRFCFWPKRPGG